MASESNDSDLRERVEQLEATVEQQQQTIRKMLPGRRGALKAGGLLAGGGLLGAAGSDQAAAADGTQDTSDGTVRGNGGGVDVRLDELRDPGGDEVFDIDDTGAINAAVSGREFRFDSVSTEKGTVDGDDLIGFPISTSVISPGFDTWTTADVNRPSIVIVDVQAETDGQTKGLVGVEVDESGGSSRDYRSVAAFADEALPTETAVRESSLIPLPPGAQFKIQNADDPTNNNKIIFVRVMQL